MKINYKLFILCIIITYSIAFTGSIFTSGNTNSEWYQSIKPEITPPNFVFPIVWNVLFFLIALSFYFALNKKKQKNKFIILFSINLLLNVLWSLFFFELKLTTLAFIDLSLLLISTGFLIYKTRKISKISSYLLIPYFAWLFFAGLLNFLIII